MRNLRRKCIGVIGSRMAEGKTEAVAREAGEVICRLGANLVCGGLDGVMKEACRGFSAERQKLGGKGCGVTIGIIPGGNPDSANPFVDIVIPTSMGFARNYLVIQTSDVVVSVAGGSGTLNELAMAWQLGKPILAISGTGGWSEKLAGEKIDDLREDCIIKISNVKQLEEMLKKILV